MRATVVLTFLICVHVGSIALAAPAGFVKTMIPLDAPPVGLAFDAAGVLYALEAPDFLSNEATLRTILSDGTFGNSFSVLGDDPINFFVGSMAYDPWADQLLITDNTADGRLYAVSTTGAKQLIATGIAGVANVAVRPSGEIFVSTSPFGSPGEVLLVDRTNGGATPVMGGLGFGAGLAFDSVGDLIVQDADANTFRGRLQRLPIMDTQMGLEFGAPLLLLDAMQSSAGIVLESDNRMFTTGNGGLFRVAGSPLAEMHFDHNGNPSQFATAIAFDTGTSSFAPFTGPSGGRLAYLADFGFATQDSFITLLSPALPGDYNTDGIVDDADYVTWRANFGSLSDLAADGNTDGIVDTADYVLWRKYYFTGPETTAMSPAISEPAMVLPYLCWWLTLTCGVHRLSFNRRRQNRPQTQPS
jgi:hypothetical protein